MTENPVVPTADFGQTLSELEREAFKGAYSVIWKDGRGYLDVPQGEMRLLLFLRNNSKAILALAQAAATMIENDQHIDFGIAPPGWKRTHEALHAALEGLNRG